jgi:8-oxo-dGTP pyrophosphatase MutT (NUDIX family)
MREEGEANDNKTNIISLPGVLTTVLSRIIDESKLTASAKRFILEDLYRFYDKKCKDERRANVVSASATVIVVSQEGKILIGKRADKGKYPGLWTVPGGKLKKTDGDKPNQDGTIYRIAEKGVIRELTEETGMRLSQLTSLTLLVSMMLKDGRFIFSFWARARDMSSDIKIRPSDDLVELKWIDTSQICNYEFVPGLDEELVCVFQGIDDAKEIYLGRE